MRRRYEIVREGGTWTVGTGGPSLRGYHSVKAAITAAIAAARDAERAGQHITIHLWEHGVDTKVYATSDNADQHTATNSAIEEDGK